MTDFRTEFGADFAMPSPMPEGFDDISWSQDACPSFMDAKRGIKLWIDYEKPEDREFPESHRYCLENCDEEGATEGLYPILTTDDWAEVLAYLAEEK